jgi:hypothetical protein
MPEEAPMGGPLQAPVADAPLDAPVASQDASVVPPAQSASNEMPPSPAPAEIKLASLQPMTAPEAEGDAPDADAADGFEWPTGAEECLRDWLPAEHADAASSDCTTTDVLIAAVEASEQPALAEAATEHAELLAALPPLPRPRPEPPADFKPSNPHATRVSSNRNSSWPPEPPPACPGQHAKWRFVDRKAGTKEWYCR